MKSVRWMGALLCLAALAACSDRQEQQAVALPVLVVQPGQAAAQAPAVFAGEVRARQESPLSFRVGGNLIRRHVDAGQRVQRGQVLAELDAADFGLQARAAQAQLEAANADLVRTRDDLARYRTLAEQQLVSRSTLDQQDAAFKAAQGQASAARANLAVLRNQSGYAQLRAPTDGVIASREAEAGQVVSAGQTVFNLAADGGRDVLIALPEATIADYAVGQPVEVELWNRPGPRLAGSIGEIAAAADPQARTYAARVHLDPAALQGVALGQSARVYSRAGRGGALQLPLSALQRGDNGAATVWVVDPASATLRQVTVQTGAYGSHSVPVLSGVAADDWVVAAGGHLLRAGQAVTAVDRHNRPVLAPTAPGTAQGKE